MIKKGDFILMTDYRNSYDRYLKVGEVANVENEGRVEVKYEVRFGGNYIDYDDIEYFGKELSEQCRVLKFESR